MGTSFGGMVALNLAVRHPQLVDRMVLSCTSPGGEHPSYPLQNLRDMGDEAFATRMRINDSRWDPEADEPIPGMGTYYDTMVAQARATPDPEVMVGLAKQLVARAGHDVEAHLSSIEHETLVCAGRYDGTAPLPNSELLADSMPDGRLAVFEGGHLFFLQDRTAYGSMIEFLQHGHVGPPEPSDIMTSPITTSPITTSTITTSTITTSTENH
jgi:3-oxoadipate enol-lactonase